MGETPTEQPKSEDKPAAVDAGFTGRTSGESSRNVLRRARIAGTGIGLGLLLTACAVQDGQIRPPFGAKPLVEPGSGPREDTSQVVEAGHYVPAADLDTNVAKLLGKPEIPVKGDATVTVNGWEPVGEDLVVGGTLTTAEPGGGSVDVLLVQDEDDTEGVSLAELTGGKRSFDYSELLASFGTPVDLRNPDSVLGGIMDREFNDRPELVAAVEKLLPKNKKPDSPLVVITEATRKNG